MPTRIAQLKHDTKFYAEESRHHKLTNFEKVIAGNDRTYYDASCKHCGHYVRITPKPLPNEIEVGGEVVALTCSHYPLAP